MNHTSQDRRVEIHNALPIEEIACIERLSNLLDKYMHETNALKELLTLLEKPDVVQKLRELLKARESQYPNLYQ